MYPNRFFIIFFISLNFYISNIFSQYVYERGSESIVFATPQEKNFLPKNSWFYIECLSETQIHCGRFINDGFELERKTVTFPRGFMHEFKEWQCQQQKKHFSYREPFVFNYIRYKENGGDYIRFERQM